MWKKIKDTQYFLLFSKEGGYEISVTDYLNVWTSFYTEKEFLARLKDSNDGLELPQNNDFLQKGIHLLSNLDNLKKVNIEKKDNGKNLFITMTISFGFPFYLECNLLKGSEEVYFQKVTRPLLKIVCDLKDSQTELRYLLMKKDREIEEYKCEGGEIALRHIKTVAFNDEEHMKKHRAYEQNYETYDKSTNLFLAAVENLEKNILKQPAVSENLERKIKTELVDTKIVVKMDPVSSTNIEPEPIVKTEPMFAVKVEQHSEVAQETSSPIIMASGSCKQEVKREIIRAHIPKKRSKFNF